MTNSTEGQLAAGSSLLDELLAELRQDRLVMETSQTVQRALQRCDGGLREDATIREFFGLVGSFVQHLRRHSQLLRLDMPLQLATAQAVSLLDGHYLGVLADSHGGAYLDATRSGGPGLQSVLQELQDTPVEHLLALRLRPLTGSGRFSWSRAMASPRTSAQQRSRQSASHRYRATHRPPKPWRGT